MWMHMSWGFSQTGPWFHFRQVKSLRVYQIGQISLKNPWTIWTSQKHHTGRITRMPAGIRAGAVCWTPGGQRLHLPLRGSTLGLGSLGVLAIRLWSRIMQHVGQNRSIRQSLCVLVRFSKIFHKSSGHVCEGVYFIAILCGVWELGTISFQIEA